MNAYLKKTDKQGWECAFLYSPQFNLAPVSLLNYNIEHFSLIKYNNLQLNRGAASDLFK